MSSTTTRVTEIRRAALFIGFGVISSTTARRLLEMPGMDDVRVGEWKEWGSRSHGTAREVSPVVVGKQLLADRLAEMFPARAAERRR